jgi:hypothetical protein
MSTTVVHSPPNTPDGNSTSLQPPRWWLRWTFAAVCLGIFVWMGWDLVHVVRNATRLEGTTQVDAIAYTDLVKSAIVQKLDGSKTLVQGSFLVFAALWSLVIAKKGEAKLVMGDWPELIMFGVASLCFVLSWYCSAEYSDAVAMIQAQGGLTYEKPEDQTIMDFRDPRFNDLTSWQYHFCLMAIIAACLTLVSAHMLKEPSCDNTSPSSLPFS